jgi:peroxin-5
VYFLRSSFKLLTLQRLLAQRYEEPAYHIFDALVLQDSDGVRDGVNPDDKRGVASGALWDYVYAYATDGFDCIVQDQGCGK